MTRSQRSTAGGQWSMVGSLQRSSELGLAKIRFLVTKTAPLSVELIVGSWFLLCMIVGAVWISNQVVGAVWA